MRKVSIFDTDEAAVIEAVQRSKAAKGRQFLVVRHDRIWSPFEVKRESEQLGFVEEIAWRVTCEPMSPVTGGPRLAVEQDYQVTLTSGY